MATDIRDKVADSLLALMPLYHRLIFKVGSVVPAIRIAQYRVLGLLMKSGARSMSEIGRDLYISKPYMTALADTLIENGWVERRDDPDDRRVVKIAITPTGKKHLQQAFEVYHADVKALISGLEEEDLKQLSASLKDVQRIFTKLG